MELCKVPTFDILMLESTRTRSQIIIIQKGSFEYVKSSSTGWGGQRRIVAVWPVLGDERTGGYSTLVQHPSTAPLGALQCFLS